VVCCLPGSLHIRAIAWPARRDAGGPRPALLPTGRLTLGPRRRRSIMRYGLGQGSLPWPRQWCSARLRPCRRAGIIAARACSPPRRRATRARARRRRHGAAAEPGRAAGAALAAAAAEPGRHARGVARVPPRAAAQPGGPAVRPGASTLQRLRSPACLACICGPVPSRMCGACHTLPQQGGITSSAQPFWRLRGAARALCCRDRQCGGFTAAKSCESAPVAVASCCRSQLLWPAAGQKRFLQGCSCAAARAAPRARPAATAGAARRGGPKSADHVNILANADLLEDVLHIAAGRGAELGDRFLSGVQVVEKHAALCQ